MRSSPGSSSAPELQSGSRIIGKDEILLILQGIRSEGPRSLSETEMSDEGSLHLFNASTARYNDIRSNNVLSSAARKWVLLLQPRVSLP